MSENRTKICFVVDGMTSGLGLAASARAEINPNIQIVAALDFSSPGSLIDFINDNDYALVLFSWRFALWELLQVRKGRAIFNKTRGKTQFAVSIPDHVGLELNFRKKEDYLLKAVDYFFVTNSILANQYKNLGYVDNFAGILHDLPLSSDIEKVRNMKLEKVPNRIIWVGNSKWGKRQGFIDHKGFSRWIAPLKEKLEAEYGISVTIVDSTRRKEPHLEVLKEISISTVLLQASDSEGTGIPILEALAFNTIPVSTEVGVFAEIFKPQDPNFVKRRTLNDFAEAILESMEEIDPSSMQQIFLDYLYDARLEKVLNDDIPRRRIISKKTSIWLELLINLKWLLRYWKNQLKIQQVAKALLDWIKCWLFVKKGKRLHIE